MPPATAELVLTLNRLGTRRDNPILASMYRHLAYWPSYLSLTWAFIAPLDADGSLARSIDDAIAKAQTRAARHVMPLHAQSEMSIAPSDGAAIRSAIEPFAGDVIAKMVVICGTLRAASGNL
jgi:hypothetical protein